MAAATKAIAIHPPTASRAKSPNPRAKTTIAPNQKAGSWITLVIWWVKA